MEIKLTEKTERRLSNLAQHNNVSESEIIESLLDRHMKVINIAVMEEDKLKEFIATFARYIQKDLDSLEDIEGKTPMYEVFEALFAHTLQNEVILTELYEVYEKHK